MASKSGQSKEGYRKNIEIHEDGEKGNSNKRKREIKRNERKNDNQKNNRNVCETEEEEDDEAEEDDEEEECFSKIKKKRVLSNLFNFEDDDERIENIASTSSDRGKNKGNENRKNNKEKVECDERGDECDLDVDRWIVYAEKKRLLGKQLNNTENNEVTVKYKKRCF